LKGLPPSLRYRKRYIVFEIKGESRINKQEMTRELWRNLVSLFGDEGSADTRMWVEEFDMGKGIIRCSVESVDKIKLALLTLKDIKGENILPVIHGVFGTLKKAEICMKEVETDAITSNGL